ncbi:DUF4136 domain-containing protein [Halopseudomonas bauzanensis]|uniref:DUF4136 domain-containing protein n=1 Tax=Halopseudomonas bauzanensis TaxID=653930 RepID=A0A4V5NMT3_9GAMM|nr:DUF4136 domain-containing protein [Halopseudomonas bauzanensis]TKA92797.1 DUF4136 domain-containing protein [Halopseudomonas bauzanensis]
MLRFMILLSLLMLGACQATGPRADYDLSRDFSQYQTWSWADPPVTYAPANDPRLTSDLTSQRVLEAVAAQLDVRGLRPAQPANTADLKVRASVVLETRRDNVTTHYGGGWGYWGPYWGGPGYSQTRTVDYQVMTLQIDMLDASDGRLVWRGSDSQTVRERHTPLERNQEMHERAAKVLSTFPPN